MQHAIIPLLLLFATLLTSRAAFAQPAADSNKGAVHKMIILHTNDLHGHLTAWTGWEGELKGKQVGGLGRLAGAIRDVRKESPDNVLLLDAGDLLGDTMIADLTKGAALIEALNFLRYDAFTVGNHEPDFTAEVLKQRIAEASFPTVAANLFNRSDGMLFTKPYVLKKVGGVTVGILGLAYPNTSKTTAKKNAADLDFQEPVAAVKRNIPKMREEGAEIIVVLSHLGLGGDKHLAKAANGIDVIVGGHSHNRMAEAERVGSTLIVQSGAHGSDLGRLDLTIQSGKVTRHQRTLIPLLHEKIATDPAAEALLKKILAPYRAKLEESIGSAKGWIIRAQTLAGQEARKREQESPADSLFADIIRAKTKSGIAFLPGVGYGVAIPEGPVTAAQLRQLVPHEGKVVTLRLTGAKVLEVLEKAIENTYSDDPAVKVGGMIQVSGIRFEYDPARRKAERVIKIEQTDGAWSLDAEYAVATNSMLAAGGHNYLTFAKADGKTERGSQYEMIRDWIQEHSPVSTPEVGRIKNAGK